MAIPNIRYSGQVTMSQTNAPSLTLYIANSVDFKLQVS